MVNTENIAQLGDSYKIVFLDWHPFYYYWDLWSWIFMFSGLVALSFFVGIILKEKKHESSGFSSGWKRVA